MLHGLTWQSSVPINKLGSTSSETSTPIGSIGATKRPFLEKNVPCVFLSVEDHEDYHQVTDHTEKIIPELAAKTAQLAFLAAIDLARPVP